MINAGKPVSGQAISHNGFPGKEQDLLNQRNSKSCMMTRISMLPFGPLTVNLKKLFVKGAGVMSLTVTS
jgi:hypothetical protein